jgi:hypothetical protein
VLVAFALRTYLLGAANLWWDEAYSVWLARRPLAELLRTTAFDVHPPLYYVLLRGWIELAGDSEFSLRYLSVAGGVLTVVLLYPLGVRVIGRRAAAVGAVVLAVSGLHIWWSQETRMYVLAAGWATLALYLTLRQMDRPRRWWGWAAVALAVTAAMYTLYLAALVIPVAGLIVLGSWAARRVRFRAVLHWTVAQVVALTAFLPWLLYALPRIRTEAAGADFPPALVLALHMLLLATGTSTHVERYLPIVIGYGLLVVGTLAGLPARRRWDLIAVLAPPLLLPPLVVYLLAVARWRFYAPAPEARYFLLFAPASALVPAAAAWLLTRWRRWAGILLAVAVAGLALSALPARYAGRYLRDQWRSATLILGSYARPDDVVLLVSGDRYPLFLYEYERLPADRPPVRLVPDGILTLTPDTVDEQMRHATDGAPRVWLVEIEAAIQDPDGLARAWMDAAAYPALSVAFDHNRLTLYTPDGAPPLVAAGRLSPQRPLAEGPLLGVDLPIREARPGDTIHLGLYAQPSDLTVRLVHSSGLVLDQREVVPLVAEGIVRHDVPFAVTQATPRGQYTLGAEGLHLATVQVTHSDPLWTEQDVPVPLAARFGESLELVGHGLDPERPRPGDAVSVDLYWRARTPVADAYTVFVQIVGPFDPARGSPLWGQHDGPPVGGAFATSSWPPTLIVRDRHTLTFDPAAPPGDYALIAGLYDPWNGERLELAGHPDDALPLVTFSLP